jgi:hypothetical protein
MYAQWKLRQALALRTLDLLQGNALTSLSGPWGTKSIQMFSLFIDSYCSRHQETLAPEELKNLTMVAAFFKGPIGVQFASTTTRNIDDKIIDAFNQASRKLIKVLLPVQASLP